MTQKDRISMFVSNLLESQLTEGQCACVLGEDEKGKKKKEKKKKGKSQTEKTDALNCANSVCKNTAPEKCGRHNRDCVNYGYNCMESSNRYCLNTDNMMDVL